MNKKLLPYGLLPHEIAFLILLGVAFYLPRERSIT